MVIATPFFFHNTQTHLDIAGSTYFVQYLKENVRKDTMMSINAFEQDRIGQELTPTKVAVITTTNVLLAEELCTRIGMFADGELLSLNTANEMKKMYGNGYTLEITLPRISNRNLEHQETWWEYVESRIQKRFGENFGLTEKFLDRRVYLVIHLTSHASIVFYLFLYTSNFVLFYSSDTNEKRHETSYQGWKWSSIRIQCLQHHGR